MISDEPDEDADNLDDDNLLEAYLESTIAKDGAGGGATGMLDWPPSPARTTGLNISPKTLAWFQRHHASWRQEIEFVLSAWIVARTRPADRQADSAQPDDQRLDGPQPDDQQSDHPTEIATAAIAIG